MNNGAILIAGGGTGGHIYPGLSLLTEFKKEGSNATILTGRKDLEYIPESLKNNSSIFIFNAPSFPGNIIKFPGFAGRFLSAAMRVVILLKKQKIVSVIGMGGYVSAPAIFAAVLLKLPVFLCEQNTIPGKVTVRFARKAVNIFTSFEVSRNYLKNAMQSAIIHTGNPLRENVFTVLKKGDAKRIYNLSHCKKVVLAIGGSQGAVRINELILDVVKNFPDELCETGLIWITGALSYDKYKNALNEAGGTGSVFICPFIDNIGTAYKACDLTVSRAGAGAVMEFAALGLPSILIPYPYAADNHQDMNADVCVNAGAAVKIENNDSSENLGNLIIDLLNNPVRLTRMSEAARSLGNAGAAKEIVSHVIEKLNTGTVK